MKIKLDDLDRQILDVLIENTRTPFTDIAKKMNVFGWNHSYKS